MTTTPIMTDTAASGHAPHVPRNKRRPSGGSAPAASSASRRVPRHWQELPTFRRRGGIVMPTRNVVLTDQHEELIARLVRSGRYRNASEVMRESLRLMERRESEDGAKLAALRERFERAEAQVEAGDVLDDDEGLLERFDDGERAGR
jgi:antitoxin ParD1/3/4